MQIDTVGGRFEYKDKEGNSHEAVVFVAVLKYSN